MREWQEPQPVDVPAELDAAVGGHRLIGERLTRQGIKTEAAAQAFLDPAYYAPASANDLPDIDRAVERLRLAMRRGERILVWGDFDVDGQTSTALLFQALRSRGAKVRYFVPNRFRDGHGMHLPTLKQKLDSPVDLVLTCDTGVSAHEAVAFAASRGIDTVITDHHTLPEALPDAAAVVNPRRLPEAHPLRELPGVGVAWLLIQALFPDADNTGLLDLVALGIVADVMPQVDDTRFLLQRGLDVLRQNRRPGIRALLERAAIDPAELNEGHIGFALGPRLNAAGRLDDANAAVELLLTDDWARARQLANTLEGLNARRKFLSNQVYQSAVAQIENEPALLDYAALVLCQADWHSGVIGIVASRLVEEFARPVVLIAAPDDIGRGSARSINGVDITAAFERASRHLRSYGGHAMAAGLSLPADRIFEFRRELSQVTREMTADAPPRRELAIDGYIGFDEVSLDLARDIARLAPFGNGNPALALATRDVRLVKRDSLGRGGDHLRVTLEDADGRRQRVIWWRGAGQSLPSGRFDLAYTLRVSHYRGEHEALLEWLDCRQRQSLATGLSSAAFARDIIDLRRSPCPAEELANLRQKYPDASIWREVEALDGAVDRLRLHACETLIVCAAPPSAEIWAAALATVNPARLILLGMSTVTERRAAFLLRLAALLKYAVNHKGGVVALESLAAATSQREAAARLGLQLLGALGKLDYRVTAAGQYQIRLANRGPSEDAAVVRQQLDLHLRESRAYRAYWMAMQLSEFHKGT